MRQSTAVLIVSLSILTSVWISSVQTAVADDNDIFGSTVEPNVMILIDSSLSMAEEIESSTYDAGTTYLVEDRCGQSSSGGRRRGRSRPGTDPCESPIVYQSSRSSIYTIYGETIADVPDSAARAALSTDGYWSGYILGSYVNLSLGNYLNYGFAGGSNTEPKIDIAKRVVTSLIQNTEGVRFGVMKFNLTDSGARMVAPIGTPKATMIAAVNAMTLDGFTPTGPQILDAGEYYKGDFGSYLSPIEVACQPNFAIVVSDGDANRGIAPEDAATILFTEDHATGAAFPGVQNVLVHTVGFGNGLSASGLQALQDTADNGGGNFYTADNSTELESSLQDAIRQIAAATFTFASPVIPTTSTTGVSAIYSAAFRTDAVRPFWTGFLKAYARDDDGNIPVDANGKPLASALIWEAGNELAQKAAADRTLYTVIGGTRQEFLTTNLTITPSDLDVSTAAEKDDIIGFIRGIDTFDEDQDDDTTEERSWKLGDIYHSNPVLVSPPFLALTDTSYLTFKSNNANRTTILLTGANDGVLHAFRASDGDELWGFIPPDQLERLQQLTDRSAEHDYYVDSSPIVADIKVGNNWKTIVVFGERRGGPYLHALDVTDTTDPQYLWSFTDAEIAETWSEPAIGKIQLEDGSEKYVGFIGGGYDTNENNQAGRAVFAIDLATGAKIWEYRNPGSTSDDRQYMNFSIVANPTALDLNGDGYVDRLYLGDVGGQLWKFDLSDPATLSGGMIDNWTGRRLFATDSGQANPPSFGEYYPFQPIYGSVTAAYDDYGDLWVYFGTGDRNHPNAASENRFYGMVDDGAMTNGTTVTEADLVDVTTTYAPASDGWFIRLGTDEKILSGANVFNRVVFFSTFTSETALTCNSGGTARLYGVSMTTGYAGIDWATGNPLSASGGTTGTQLSTSDGARSIVVGSGIASEPIVVIDENGAAVTSSVISATTDEQILTNPAPPPVLREILYWREIF